MKLKVTFYSLIALLLASGARAQTIYGITTDDRVFSIPNASAPGTTTTPVAITGLGSGMTAAGADFRATSGEFYILGYNSGTGATHLYTLNTTTGVTSPVGVSDIQLALGSGAVAIDFEPTTDLLRVQAANGRNYLIDPNTGGISNTGTNLTLNGSTPTVGAISYSNSYIASEATTLYVYDPSQNNFYTEDPNTGVLTLVGPSGVLANMNDLTRDLDIYYNPATQANVAYFNASTLNSTADNLYTVNLATGLATNVGQIGTGLNVKKITVAIQRNVPANVIGQTIYGLTKTFNNLISFDSQNPTVIRTSRAVSGITAGQRIVGMDFRPLNRVLYALGYDSARRTAQLYSVNTSNAQATAINTVVDTLDLGAVNGVGFDFNPTADRIRITSPTNGRNYRMNPADGKIAATDSTLRYSSDSSIARINSIAYTNSFSGSSATVLYGIDPSRNTFARIEGANGNLSRVVKIDSNFLTLNATDYSVDMDFYYDSIAAGNLGFLAANPGTAVNDNLYTIDIVGRVTLKAAIGYGVPVKNIAIMPTYRGANSVQQIASAKEVRMRAIPNPVQGTTQIELADASKGGTLELIDLSGKTLRSVNYAAGQQRVSFDLSALAPGLYLVRDAADRSSAIRVIRN